MYDTHEKVKKKSRSKKEASKENEKAPATYCRWEKNKNVDTEDANLFYWMDEAIHLERRDDWLHNIYNSP